MKYVLYILLLTSHISIYAQFNWNEYIQNPSFELYDTCPTNFSQPLDYQIEHCIGWHAPTAGTSDYFNECNLTTVSVPQNIFGYQYAFDGVAYCGLYSNQYSLQVFQCPNNQYTFYGREYIQTKLKKKLIANTLYYFSFYISLADTIGGYACKNIGALFSAQSYQVNCWKPIIANPQIKSPDFVTDNLNWTKVEGYFVAEGDEEYLTIGNFRDTTEFYLDTLCVKPGTDWQIGDGMGYYFIDGITFNEVDEIILPNVISPNDDGINDAVNFEWFNIFGHFKITIYNRWGNEVFSNNNPNTPWEGKNKQGHKLSAGTYYYVLSYGNSSSDAKQQTGFIQLFNQ